MSGKEQETIQQRYDRISGELGSHEDSANMGGNNGLYADINPMCYISELVYAYAVLTNRAANEELVREDLIVPEQITTQNMEMRMKVFSEPLRTKVTVQNVVEFVRLNLAALGDESRINSDLFIHALITLSQMKSAYLVHFNGDFSGETFVYGILVNHDQKRITTVFRGAVELGDWCASIKFRKSTLTTPDMLSENLGFDKKKKIGIHRGFKDFLFYDSGPNEAQKYSQLKKLILELYQSGDCDGYDCFVTGHSLGGALSTIMAFNLAASQKFAQYLGHKPIVNVTFGSPYVGGHVWAEAFQVLEKAGKIQHVRVSNKGDIVQALLPVPNYVHTGVNLFLDPKIKNGYELSYGDTRSLLWQAGCNAQEKHTLLEYYTRMRDIKHHIKNMTVRDVYAEDASIPKEYFA